MEASQESLGISPSRSPTEDSSDEEDDSFNVTYNNSIGGERPFKFYEFGVHPVPFTDLLDHLSEQKYEHHENLKKHPPRKPKPVKTFDIRAYQKTTMDHEMTMSKTVARFHPVEAKWEGTKTPDEQMLKDLYRIPFRDPTGKMIFSLSRDEAKGCKVWKKPEPGRDIPAPTFAQCSLTFQIQALKVLEESIQRVEEEYKHLPSNSVAKSTYKAKVGADLNNLKLECEHILKEIEEFQAAGGHHGGSPHGSPSATLHSTNAKK
jgi:hypothetical protein